MHDPAEGPSTYVEQVGDRDQWERVDRAERLGGYAARRAQSARRNARLFGTDPSWYGF